MSIFIFFSPEFVRYDQDFNFENNILIVEYEIR